MKKTTRLCSGIFTIVSITIIGAIFNNAPYPSKINQNEPTIANPNTAITAYHRWRIAKSSSSQADTVALGLFFSKAHSTKFSEAQGQAVINLTTGLINISVNGLVAENKHDVWLVDETTNNNEKNIKLGQLSMGQYASLSATLDPEQMKDFSLNRIVISNADKGFKEDVLLNGSPSIFRIRYKF